MTGGKMPARRIQRRRERGWRMPEGAVYVGRPTVYGNPFRVGDLIVYPHPGAHYAPFWSSSVHPVGAYSWFDVRAVESADEAVSLYARWIEYESFREFGRLRPLRGRDLACWCPLDQPCHADVLLELANR